LIDFFYPVDLIYPAPDWDYSIYHYGRSIDIKANDEPAADLLRQWMQIHEKNAWMLRSLLEDKQDINHPIHGLISGGSCKIAGTLG
jgi:hypothetical protein